MSDYLVPTADEAAGAGGFSDVASLEGRFATIRFRGAGRATGGGSSFLMSRRWPSNTEVSQARWRSLSAAQIFAAAAASLNGPATRRSCSPGPVLRSLTTMIG